MAQDLMQNVLKLVRPLEPGRAAVSGWVFEGAAVAGGCVELLFRNSGPGGAVFKMIFAEKTPGAPSAFTSKNFSVSYVQPEKPSSDLDELVGILEFQIKNRDDLDSEEMREAWRELRSECGGSDSDGLESKLDEIRNMKFSQDTVFHLVVESECANRCVFCEGTIRGRGGAAAGCSTADYLKIIGANRSLGLKSMKISGNEPLLRGDVEELVAASKASGFETVEIHTSGCSLNDEDRIERLIAAGADALSIPIYSSDAATHDAIVGRDGAFGELMDALRILKEHGRVRVNLYSLILKQNLGSLGSLIEMGAAGFPQFHHGFNTVRPCTDDPDDYAAVAPAYSDVLNTCQDERILRVMPMCVAGSRMPESRVRELARMRTAERVHELRIMDVLRDASIEQIEKRSLPGKCAACAMSEACNHPFGQYVAVYGDGEFKPYQV